MRVTILSGRTRWTFELLPGRANRQSYASDIKRYLFPKNGTYFKAKRRGERALMRLPV